MNANQMRRIVKSLDYKSTGNTSGWIEPTILNYFSLTGDRTLSFTFFKEKINFDFQNSLIKIKKYNTELVSRTFSNWVYNSETNSISVKKKEGVFLKKITNKLNKFRNPKAEDKIFVLNNETKGEIEDFSTEIETIVDSGEILTITFSSMFDLSEYSPYNFSLFYVGKDEYSSATAFSENESLYLIYTPVTSNDVDVYFEFEPIIFVSLLSEN